MSAARGVSAGSYVRAGQAAWDNTIGTIRAARNNSPKYGDIANEGIKQRAETQVAGIRAQSEVAQAGIRAEAAIRKSKIQADRDKSIGESRATVRKAGKIAAAGMLIGDNITEGKRAKERNKMEERHHAEKMAYWQKQQDASKADDEKDKVEMGEKGITLEPEQSKPLTSLSPTPTPSNQSFPLTDLSNLSEDDKREIAYIVSGEAERGTDDIFGVAGVVINRMKSKDYPSSAYDVGRQKGQFEAVEIGKARYEPELQEKLFSDQGLIKLQDALTKLKGRDSFKGQTMIKNRVPSEDPMFSERGNFYHYSHQT